jgi:hypothetical protein
MHLSCSNSPKKITEPLRLKNEKAARQAAFCYEAQNYRQSKTACQSLFYEIVKCFVLAQTLVKMYKFFALIS